MTNRIRVIAFATLLVVAVSANAQMNVGSAAVANSGAILDVSNINAVSTTYKGVFLPQVLLTATNVYGLNTANSPTAVNGMLVYNKQAAGSGTTAVVVGAYVWQANVWNLVMFSGTLQGETTRASLGEKATADSLVTEINTRAVAVAVLTTTVNTATTIANVANTTATTANTTANAANATANAATTASTAAITAATTANTTANAANTAANAATSSATAANTTANTANSTANAANGIANAAISIATAANTTAATLTSNLTAETTRAKLGEKATADSLVTEINTRAATVAVLQTTVANNAAVANNGLNVTNATVAVLQTTVANNATTANNGLNVTNVTVANLQTTVANNANLANANIASLQTSVSALNSNLTTTNNNVSSTTTTASNALNQANTAYNAAMTANTNANVATSGVAVEAANRTAATPLEIMDEFTAGTNQTSFTLSRTPSSRNVIKMYIKGLLISKTAHSNSGTTETYNVTNNGGTTLILNDRVQIVYNY